MMMKMTMISSGLKMLPDNYADDDPSPLCPPSCRLTPVVSVNMDWAETVDPQSTQGQEQGQMRKGH